MPKLIAPADSPRLPFIAGAAEPVPDKNPLPAMGAIRTIEIALPEDQTAGPALATPALLQQALLTATPIITFIPERRYG
jgi:hypothetical protein